jgi:hypothetical protein
MFDTRSILKRQGESHNKNAVSLPNLCTAEIPHTATISVSNKATFYNTFPNLKNDSVHITNTFEFMAQERSVTESKQHFDNSEPKWKEKRKEKLVTLILTFFYYD